MVPFTQKRPSTPRITDMTEGSPLRLIIAFAIPIFIGNIFQEVYTMVDTMVVGHHLGDRAIAAVGASASLYNLIISMASGLNSGYAIVVTRHFGAKREGAMKQALAGMMLLNLTATVLLTALALCGLPHLLSFMNTPQDIYHDTYIYIMIICAGMVATNAYNMFACILRSVGNSRAPLFFLILSCGVNILLDLLFVIGLDTGVAGAAAATVVAQTVSAAACGWYLFRRYRPLLPEPSHFRVPQRILSDLLGTGFAMAMMLCVVDLGTIFYSRATNALGHAIITAHTTSRRLVYIVMQPAFAIGNANATFVGQNWGAGKHRRIRSALRQVTVLEVSWSVAAAATIFIIGPTLVTLVTGTAAPEVLDNTVMSMRLHAAFFPELAVLLILRTSMQAMGRKTAPVLSSCIELSMKILSAMWLIPSLGFLGTCLTEPITWLLMMLFLTATYLRQRKTLLKEA